MTALKIGIIGGTGWMGRALGEAWLATGCLSPNQLWISNRSGANSYAKLYPDVHFTTDTQVLADACDVIVLAVLPQQFGALNLQLGSQLVVSIMAMVSLEALEQHLGSKNLVRSMPNAAIPELAAYTPWLAHKTVTAEAKAQLRLLLQSFGTEAEVACEDHLNFLTALTGSSHGWLAYVAKTLIQMGVEHGLSESLVEPAIRAVMQGVGALIAHEPHSPQQTVQILTDYAGSTAAGLLAFDRCGAADALRQGIKASYERARKPY